MKTYYLHTLNEKPAEFYDHQICFASFYGKANLLATDLKQIRREQQLSKAWRTKQGYGTALPLAMDISVSVSLIKAFNSSPGIALPWFRLR